MRPGDLSKVAVGRTAEIPESIFPAVVRSKHTWCAIRVFISHPRVVLRRCLPGSSLRLLRRGRRTCSFCCALPHVPLASLVPGKTSPHHEDIQTAYRCQHALTDVPLCSSWVLTQGQHQEHRDRDRRPRERAEPRAGEARYSLWHVSRKTDGWSSQRKTHIPVSPGGPSWLLGGPGIRRRRSCHSSQTSSRFAVSGRQQE